MNNNYIYGMLLAFMKAFYSNVHSLDDMYDNRSVEM